MKINLSGRNFSNVLVDSLDIAYTHWKKFRITRCDANELIELQQDSNCHDLELFTGDDYYKMEICDVVDGNLNVKCSSLDMYKMQHMSYKMRAIRNHIKEQLDIEDLSHIDLTVNLK